MVGGFPAFPVLMQCMPLPRVQPAVATVTSHTLNFLHSSICWWLESGMTLYALRCGVLMVNAG